jgi:hypothetical protein
LRKNKIKEANIRSKNNKIRPFSDLQSILQNK